MTPRRGTHSPFSPVPALRRPNGVLDRAGALLAVALLLLRPGRQGVADGIVADPPDGGGAVMI